MKCGTAKTPLPLYEGVELTPKRLRNLQANAGPITFDGTNEKFNAQTTDGDLIGTTKKWGLKSELTDYQLKDVTGAPTTTIEGDVNFINPCLKPFTFDNSMQQDNAKNDLEDNYSDNDPIEFTLN